MPSKAKKTKKEGDPSGGDGGGDGSDADSGSESPTAAAPAPLVPFSLGDLHAAMTATAPSFPAYALRATAAAPSKGRASYVRRFCRVLRTSTMPLSGPLRRSWAIARLLGAIAVDHAWVDRMEVALDGDDGDALVTAVHLATVAMTAADPGAHARFDRYAQALPVASIKDGDCTRTALVARLREHLDACLDTGARPRCSRAISHFEDACAHQ